jgi:hypothetical protein
MHTMSYLDATGNVAGANGGTLHGVFLTGGSDAATLVIRQGGSGGAIVMTLKAAANAVVSCPDIHGAYRGQLHATFTGTTPVATFVTGL